MRISDWSSDVCSSDLPAAGCGCPAAASSVTGEQVGDLGFEHAIEILRYRELSRHEAQPPNLTRARSVECHDLHHRSAGFGDDERIAPRRLLDQPGPKGTGVLDVAAAHVAPSTKFAGFSQGAQGRCRPNRGTDGQEK